MEFRAVYKKLLLLAKSLPNAAEREETVVEIRRQFRAFQPNESNPNAYVHIQCFFIIIYHDLYIYIFFIFSICPLSV